MSPSRRLVRGDRARSTTTSSSPKVDGMSLVARNARHEPVRRDVETRSFQFENPSASPKDRT